MSRVINWEILRNVLNMKYIVTSVCTVDKMKHYISHYEFRITLNK